LENDLPRDHKTLENGGLCDLEYHLCVTSRIYGFPTKYKDSVVVAAKRFGHGLNDLGHYLHSLGLKAGVCAEVWSDAKTRNPFQGIFEREDRDAHLSRRNEAWRHQPRFSDGPIET
jgi:hypothetical protein